MVCKSGLVESAFSYGDTVCGISSAVPQVYPVLILRPIGSAFVTYPYVEKYHVYSWIFKEYHNKSQARDPDDLEGYDWYLEMVFEGDVLWHLFGYNEYPDTYVHLGREIEKITGMDLLEIETISPDDIELFNRFADEILS